MNLQDVMIDLETLGTGPKAVVLSIGAVFFDKEELGNTFYAVLDTLSQETAGRVVDPKTVQWWSEQSEEAKTVLTAPQIPTGGVLHAFVSYLRATDIRIWGNGATFDNVILASLFEDFGVPKPWGYSADRCYRTLRNISNVRGQLPNREGTYHNALDDAIYQAKCAQLYLKGSIELG